MKGQTQRGENPYRKNTEYPQGTLSSLYAEIGELYAEKAHWESRFDFESEHTDDPNAAALAGIQQAIEALDEELARLLHEADIFSFC